jgi:D-alanyl-D-alanine carboxypeptidase
MLDVTAFTYPFADVQTVLPPPESSQIDSRNWRLPTISPRSTEIEPLARMNPGMLTVGQFSRNEILQSSRQSDFQKQRRGSKQQDRIKGDTSADDLLGLGNDDVLIGNSGNDRLRGGQGNDTLLGQSGNDRLTGGSGNDELNGGVGRDRLFGGTGDDYLTDWDGGDRLTGGSGADLFRIGASQSQSPTKIQDFQAGTDSLQILRLGANSDTVEIRDNGNGVVLVDQGKVIATLQNVRASELQPDDFIFGNAPLAQDLQRTLNQVRRQVNAPGAILGVIVPDGSSWVGGSGFSDLKNRTSINSDDRFSIGSITKPMVATLILQLVEEGKLALEDTVSEWLPELTSQIQNSDRITIRQLLSMTSGLPDYSNPLLEQALQNPVVLQRQWTPSELLSLVAEQPAKFAPGEQFDYNNTNYLLLGEIVEAVTHSTLADQLRQRIFEPLGMSNTFYAPQEQIPGGFTRGYYDFNGDGQLDDTKDNLSWTAGAGGVVSTATDTMRFTQGLFQGELLAPITFQQMLASSGDFSEQFRYGLGLLTADRPELGGRLWGHNGGSFGWRSWMIYLPDQEITLVGLLNRGPTAAEEVAGQEAIDVLALQALEAIAQSYSTESQ